MLRALVLACLLAIIPLETYANPLLLAMARKQISTLGLKGKPGLYRFKDTKTGKLYIGKSIDLERRLKQHIASGKLSPANLATLKARPMSKSMVNGAERILIRLKDHKTGGGLANKTYAPDSRFRQKTVTNTRNALGILKKASPKRK